MVLGARSRNAPLAANEYAPNCLNPRLTELVVPPKSPILVSYGGGFPAFIATFASARELPYLVEDVARNRARRAPGLPCAGGRATLSGGLTDFRPMIS